VGALIDGSALIATLPRGVAHDIRKLRPHLRTTKPPFDIEGAYVELLQRRASQDDDTLSWLRSRIEQLSDAYARAIGLAEG
jgi:LysR family transcriptional activator of mexEF-oprN operon